MEFNEMKKIWDTQSNQALYAIDEKALRNSVIKKRDKSARVANRSERILISALLFSGIVILGASLYKANYDIINLVFAGAMFSIAIFILLRRQKRLSVRQSFENSMLGDIDQAIHDADYQVRLSAFGKTFYILVGVLSVISIVDTWEEWYKGAFLLVFYVVGYFGARWEHKKLYVSQKENLLRMKTKLQEMQV